MRVNQVRTPPTDVTIGKQFLIHYYNNIQGIGILIEIINLLFSVMCGIPRYSKSLTNFECLFQSFLFPIVTNRLTYHMRDISPVSLTNNNILILLYNDWFNCSAF